MKINYKKATYLLTQSVAILIVIKIENISVFR